jgi:sugar/nucleoside kinase (ribokinase family)
MITASNLPSQELHQSHVDPFLVKENQTPLDIFEKLTKNAQEVERKISRGYSVIGLGTPYMDLVYSVTETFLDTFNLKKGDWKRIVDWNSFSNLLIAAEAENGFLPLSPTPLKMTGGSSSNTIKALASLQNSTAFFGKLGEDASSQEYRNVVRKLNINLLTEPSDSPISQVAVFVTPDGNRTFVSYPSLSTDLSSDVLLSKKPFENAKVVHFEGYMLKEFSLEFLETAIKLAKEAGSLVSFDLGAAQVVSDCSEDVFRLIKMIDIVFANELEIEALFPGNSLEEAGSILTSPEHCSVAVLLKGKEGAYIASQKNGAFTSPAHVAKPLDTVGAGDSFIAGFLHGYLKGASLEDCAWIGNLLGSAVVKVSGAEIPEKEYPLLIEKIEDYLN